ncbi:MAG TPA: hypothetical protein VF745_04530 [Steroidobacteraceae bacterium]
MAATSESSVGTSGTHIVHRGEASTGPFMLTLCRLVEPVSIRPPQSPRLKPFTFFTSRAAQRDGSEPLYLHMGFFETLACADRWARAVRGRHPDAKASVAPFALWQLPGCDAPQPVDPQPDSPRWQPGAPVENKSLTDTQVLNILEMRRLAGALNELDERDGGQIELLRPEDTGTRRALKEAVVQGLPVSFAVQLQWSTREIDPGRVPALAALKPYTLYAVESRRESRSCFFLRLGFFGDPVSAKQVASQVRSSFASAAVVPVLEEEVTRAREACSETSSIPCLVQQRRDEAVGFGTPRWASASKPPCGERRRTSHGPETLERTLAQLAEREMWNDPDLLSDTGVRHLKVEIQER